MGCKLGRGGPGDPAGEPSAREAVASDRAFGGAARDDEGEWTWENASLEDGIADFEAIITALAEYDYQGYIDLEDFRDGCCVRPEEITTEQKLQEAYDYLSPLLKEVQG
ncbi:MAG: hypothetical protein ACP5KN_19760 [Armatimonadota bacterium]